MHGVISNAAMRYVISIAGTELMGCRSVVPANSAIAARILMYREMWKQVVRGWYLICRDNFNREAISV